MRRRSTTYAASALIAITLGFLSVPLRAQPAELILPYVAQASGHEVLILLHNQHAYAAADVSVSSRAGGQQRLLLALTIAPKASRTIDGTALLAAGGRSGSQEAFVIESSGGALSATARIHAKKSGKALIVRAIARHRLFGTAVASAVWSPDRHSAAEIAVHNTSAAPQAADIFAATSRQSARIATLSIAPRTTQLVDVSKAIHDAGLDHDGEFSYGLRVEHSGAPGDVVVAGSLKNDKAGLWHQIAFTDLGHGLHDRKLRTQYVFFGAPPESYGFPGGTALRSKCVVYNPANSAVTVRPRILLIGSPGARPVDLEAISLAGSTTSTIDFEQLRKSEVIPRDVAHGALELMWEGSGRVVASLAVTDETKKERTAISRALSGHVAQRMTSEYWESSGTGNTVVVVTNAAGVADRITLEIGAENARSTAMSAELAPGEVMMWNFADLSRDGNLPHGSTRGWFAVRAAGGVRARLFVERLLLNTSPFGSTAASRSLVASHSGVYQPPEGEEPVVDDGSTVRVQEVTADAVEPPYEEGNTSSLDIPLDVNVRWTDGTTSDGSGADLISTTPYITVNPSSMSVTVGTGGEDGEGWDGGVEVKVIDDCATPIIVKSVLITLSIRFSAYEYTGQNQGWLFDQCLWRATCTGSCSTSGYVSVKVHGYEQCFDPGQPYLQCSDLFVSGNICWRKMMCGNTPVPGFCT